MIMEARSPRLEFWFGLPIRQASIDAGRADVGRL